MAIKERAIPKRPNIYINFIPETKTMADQDKTSRIVWPTSGWFNKIILGITRHKKLKKYEVFVGTKFSLDKGSRLEADFRSRIVKSEKSRRLNWEGVNHLFVEIAMLK